MRRSDAGRSILTPWGNKYALTSALPKWLPFGGDSLGTTAYEAIARPLGIIYLLILAVCPLLAWGKTDPKKFLRQAREAA